MTSLQYIFNTQIQGQHVSSLENAANALLTPVFYFCNGKRVDFIRAGTQSVCHYKPVFDAENTWHDMYETMAPVSLIEQGFYLLVFVPGLITGGILKCIAVLLFHNAQDKALVGRCTAGAVNQLCVAEESSQALYNRVNDLVGHLREHYDIAASSHVLPFFSDCTDLELRVENLAMRTRFGRNAEYRRVKNCNHQIIQNVALFWNVQRLNVQDHYQIASSRRRNLPEQAVLEGMNPLITYFHPTRQFQSMRAREFYSA